MRQERITLTREEMKRVLVIQKLIDQLLTTKEAATSLGLSTRQVLRLKATYIAEGAKGLSHKNRGKKPVHTIPESLKDKVADCYLQKYAGSNNCHFSELLAEQENIFISPSSVRRILLEKGLKPLKQRRRAKAHRPRERKPQAGLLWQLDASFHDWLEGRGPWLTLHAAIDDATGLVVAAQFQYTENMNSYFHVMHQGINRYGLPLSLYSDQHTIFFVAKKDDPSVEQELAGEIPVLTNFGLAMHDLGVTHIRALSPQAKGRVERLWGTLQDRLIIELRLLNVCSLEEANAVLPKLIEKHNRRFAVNPANVQSAYRKVDDSINLHHILCVREHRLVGPGQTISFRGKTYTFSSRVNYQLIPTKTRVEVRLNFKGQLFIWYKGEVFPLKETVIPERVRMVNNEKAGPTLTRKPAANHPWRTWTGPKELKKVPIPT
jgi:transposase